MKIKGHSANAYRWQMVVNMDEQGYAQQTISESLKLAQSSVSRILAIYRQEGSAVPKKQPGARSRLTTDQKSRLSTLIEAGSVSYGFEGEGWTNKRVAQVILEIFGVSYQERQISTILTALGFSKQRFKKVDARQDPEKVAAWKETALPALKKK